MFDTGDLVEPRTFVTDLGLKDDLQKIHRNLNDYDMSAVEGLMNHKSINEAVFSHWRQKAGNRQTIIFCSTTKHAQNVCQTFVDHGLSAKGNLGENERP